jgi:hypothetical protein
MKNRLITIECARSTYYNELEAMKRVGLYKGMSSFFTDIGLDNFICGDTVYFMEEQWNEYIGDWKGTR